VSTYVYMRLLERSPSLYDTGIRWFSWGRVDELYDRAAAAALDGTSTPRVLEIGCGTGNLTRRLVDRGAAVTAVDCSAEMLEVAARKLDGAPVELREMAAVEIADRFAGQAFDVVAASLALSEMSREERAYVVSAAYRVLRAGGRLVIADEVPPRGTLRRLAHACLRWPAAIATYVLTQSTSRPVPDLAESARAAGFSPVREERLRGDSMAVVVATKPQNGSGKRGEENAAT
jgi:ubiquinone/menaquinone biosynthesis C-methylase UbiE